MKKFDNFKNSLNVLKKVDHNKTKNDEIYRTGVIGQFNLTFELAWKVLQAVLRASGVAEAENGSPREIVKLGFRFGMIDEEKEWLNMLKDRNVSVHIYNEDAIDEVIDRIIESYIPAFDKFSDTMEEKVRDIESE